MEHDALIDAVERESDALASALSAGPPEARVPTCPDWTVRDLAVHVGGFTGFWTHVLCEGSGRPKPPFAELGGADTADGAAADAGAWYREAAAQLLEELRATPPDTAVWSWVPGHETARFVARRCAHELAVHRVDAQLARGAQEPVDGALAADGIEEIFVMIGAWGPPAGAGRGETIHLHGTDREDEWLLALGETGLAVERHHAKGDLALRGAVSDLEMVLYRRPTVGSVERFGDETALEAWYRAFTFG